MYACAYSVRGSRGMLLSSEEVHVLIGSEGTCWIEYNKRITV